MAGILDPKTRIMDFIITTTGRQEYRDGGLEFEYISFSDDGVFYATDDGKTCNDAASRIAFEACSLPRDKIIPEFDAGASITVNIPAGANLINNRMYQSGSKTLTTGTMNLYSGSQEVMRTCHQHFEWLRSLGTRNIFTVDDDFIIGISPDSSITNDENILRVQPGSYVKFTYPRGTAFFGETTGIAKMDYTSNLLPMIADPKFSHIPNFEELCPYIYDYANDALHPLGTYPAIAGTQESQTMAQAIRKDIYKGLIGLGKIEDTEGLLSHAEGLWAAGWGTAEFESLVAGAAATNAEIDFNYEEHVRPNMNPLFYRSSDGESTAYVEFSKVSDDNNLLFQVFSQNESTVEKLVLVDAGEFSNSYSDSPGTRFIHAGKIVKSSSGIPKFVRIFTFEFS